MKSTLLKVCIVIGGYIAAFAAAWVGEDIYEGLTQVMRSQSSGGMVAEGDSIMFFFLFGAMALIPTGLALYFTRTSLKFWSFLSKAAVLFALTGPFLDMLNVAMKAFGLLDLPMRMPWAFISFFRNRPHLRGAGDGGNFFSRGFNRARPFLPQGLADRDEY